jgi:diacylglycerol kinase family enzyme
MALWMVRMTAPLFFIVNPVAAGGRSSAIWRDVQAEARRRDLEYEFELTRAPLTAISFVRQALRAGARTIAVVGGDGTVFEALNGFFLDGQPVAEGAEMLVIPAGRSSDFARNLGIPDGAAALSLMKEGRLASVDIASASFIESSGESSGVPATRFFANGARVGGPPVPMPAPPDFGPMGWTGRMKADDGDELVVYAEAITVAVGPYVGGAHAAPRAKMDDGLLDVVIKDPPSGLPKDLLPGGPSDEPDARARRVGLDMDDAPPIELDGERVGAGSVDITILPGALSVYVRRP